MLVSDILEVRHNPRAVRVGDGSSGCISGWFVRYITSGPVVSLDVYNGEAIGVQLIR